MKIEHGSNKFAFMQKEVIRRKEEEEESCKSVKWGSHNAAAHFLFKNIHLCYMCIHSDAMVCDVWIVRKSRTQIKMT